MIKALKRYVNDRAMQRQIERDMRIRSARRRYEKFIDAEERRNERLHKLAVEAHVVGSNLLRDKLAQIITQTDANVRQWKERMVYFEMMQEVMSQAQACASFAEGFHSMAQSIISTANPSDLARIQADIQRSILLADQLSEMTEEMVETMDGELVASNGVMQPESAAVLQRIVSEAEGVPSALDQEIDGLLKEIGAVQA